MGLNISGSRQLRSWKHRDLHNSGKNKRKSNLRRKGEKKKRNKEEDKKKQDKLDNRFNTTMSMNTISQKTMRLFNSTPKSRTI